MRLLVMTHQHDDHVVTELAKRADEVHRVRDPDDVIQALDRRSYAVVMLDGCDSDEGEAMPQLVRRIRDADFDEPLIVFGVRHESPCATDCLQAGADDVTTTDTEADELIARVHAIIRRCTAHRGTRYEVDDLILDLNANVVARSGEKIALTPREMAVLERLMLRSDALVTRDELAEHVWDRDLSVESNLIDTFISRLRRKIDRDREKPLIHTVKGRGYLLSAQPPVRS